MNPRVLFLIVTLFSLALTAGCQSSGSPDEPADPEPAVGGEIADGENPLGPAKPRNLLLEPERAKLYLDLDTYTQRYMTARDEGKGSTWMALDASVLSPMVDRNIEELLKTVQSPDELRFRVISARGLGFGSDGARIVPALVTLLDEIDMTLLNSALVSLYILGWPGTPILPLVKYLNHADEIVRSNAALVLSVVLRKRRVGGRVPLTPEVKQAAGQLLVAVSDPADPDVRGHAASALGAIADPASTDVLINLLVDESSFVRTRAAEGLGQLGQEQAIQPLIASLKLSNTPNQTRVITAALEKIALTNGYPVDLDALGTDPATWNSWYSAVKE